MFVNVVRGAEQQRKFHAKFSMKLLAEKGKEGQAVGVVVES